MIQTLHPQEQTTKYINTLSLLEIIVSSCPKLEHCVNSINTYSIFKRNK